MAKKTVIGAPELIKIAEDYLARVEQWRNTRSLEFAILYQHQAEGVIEILEMMECGSIGGLHCAFPVGKDGLQKRLNHLKKVFL